MLRTTALTMLVAAGLVSACGSKPERYESSSFVKVHLLTYVPRHEEFTGKFYATVPARVMLVRTGTGFYPVELPESCPTEFVLRHLGRDVAMRQDVYVQSDGTHRGIVPTVEAVSVLCGRA